MSQKIIEGVARVHAANIARMIADPAGRYPACKATVGTRACERCGADVVGKTTGCEAVPPEQRWDILPAT